MNEPYAVLYPRKTALRAALKAIARAALPVLSRVEVRGVPNIPTAGPVILAGNHVAVMEIVMMLAYAPGQVEFVGAGDIPLDPTLAPYANLYGYIPLRRGVIDRDGMRTARDVLRQNGYLVVFPEGGIWDLVGMNSRLGVAWLSQEAQAPVVPVGFGGMQGALRRILKLQRPKLVMNVGEPIAPALPAGPEQNRRAVLETFARQIFAQIQSLIPESERAARASHLDEVYGLRVTLVSGSQSQDLTSILSVPQQQAVARFLCQPVLLDALRRNLHLHVAPLQHLDQIDDANAIAGAIQVVLQYLEDNAGFLTYRFGVAEGVTAAEGLAVLAGLAKTAANQKQGFTIEAERRYRLNGTGEEVVESYGRRAIEL